MKIIGYWDKSPDSVKPIDKNWKTENPEMFQKVKEFLNPLTISEKGFRVITYRGISICRICNKWNGSREYTGHNLTIPQGYLHYIVDHDLIPDESLINLISKEGN